MVNCEQTSVSVAIHFFKLIMDCFVASIEFAPHNDEKNYLFAEQIPLCLSIIIKIPKIIIKKKFKA